MPVVLLPLQFSICLSSGLVSQQPAVFSLARTEGSRASSSRLGMGPPGEAGSREVETCRGGDVVEAGVQAILMNLAEIGLLIYPR